MNLNSCIFFGESHEWASCALHYLVRTVIILSIFYHSPNKLIKDDIRDCISWFVLSTYLSPISITDQSIHRIIQVIAICLFFNIFSFFKYPNNSKIYWQQLTSNMWIIIREGLFVLRLLYYIGLIDFTANVQISLSPGVKYKIADTNFNSFKLIKWIIG